jgi:hypothetical protein
MQKRGYEVLLPKSGWPMVGAYLSDPTLQLLSWSTNCRHKPLPPSKIGRYQLFYGGNAPEFQA